MQFFVTVLQLQILWVVAFDAKYMKVELYLSVKILFCDLLLSKLRNKSCRSPVKAFGEIFWMRLRERSNTFRAIKGLKAFDGSIVSALRGRSRSDKFLMPANISGLRVPIWFCPSIRKRRFRRSYRNKKQRLRSIQWKRKDCVHYFTKFPP